LTAVKGERVALRYAILTMLIERPRSGYDLVTHFRGSVGFLWDATHQQIYRELEKLRRATLVSCKLVVQSKRPNKKVYSITAKGRRDLLAWVATPAPLQTTQRGGMLLRTYSYGRIDPEVASARLAEYRKLHEERLARLRAFFDQAVSSPDEALRTGALLTLKAGLLHEEAYIRWCDWASEFIRRARRTRPRTPNAPTA
jgi:DNA-binding PadR family transcriptional regulator